MNIVERRQEIYGGGSNKRRKEHKHMKPEGATSTEYFSFSFFGNGHREISTRRQVLESNLIIFNFQVGWILGLEVPRDGTQSAEEWPTTKDVGQKGAYNYHLTYTRTASHQSTFREP